jgi:hypothetical protein
MAGGCVLNKASDDRLKAAEKPARCSCAEAPEVVFGEAIKPQSASPDDHPVKFALVLAAGQSRRMGRPKLELPSGAADGRRVVETMLSAPFDGCGSLPPRAALDLPDDPRLEIVENPRKRNRELDPMRSCGAPRDHEVAIAPATSLVAKRRSSSS